MAVNNERKALLLRHAMFNLSVWLRGRGREVTIERDYSGEYKVGLLAPAPGERVPLPYEGTGKALHTALTRAIKAHWKAHTASFHVARIKMR